MEELLKTQVLYLKNAPVQQRYLLSKINWSNRLIGIKGARGSGKTTLLLQRMKKLAGKKTLYASLDHLYFLENSLLSLGEEFVLAGGEYLFLDEVHKYPRWSREIKLLYDQFPKLQIVFTSSSILEIYKGESDLSRRAVTYMLNELSFREYLHFEKNIEIPQTNLDDVLENHREISLEIIERLPSPVAEFKNYLKFGAYPYFLEGRESYFQKLTQTMQLIIEGDLNVVENIVYNDTLKIKKLLVAVAQSAPFTPNISKLSERLGVNRNFLVNAIKLLGRANLVMSLFKPTKGIGAFTKPEKLYLHNTNLIYALGKEHAEKGAVRETFFLNQLKSGHETHLAEKGDFLIDRRYTFEIGGKGKNKSQILGIPNSYVVRDDMEIGAMNIIPLWLFGFLY
jgi:predicted AAA+ superfamily ATPase